jgi:hypothetical protein
MWLWNHRVSTRAGKSETTVVLVQFASWKAYSIHFGISFPQGGFIPQSERSSIKAIVASARTLKYTESNPCQRPWRPPRGLRLLARQDYLTSK